MTIFCEGILAIYEKSKQYLLSRHLNKKRFSGNIYFPEGTLIKKIQKSVKDLQYPSQDIFAVTQTVKPFCISYQYTQDLCEDCKLLPSTHLEIQSVSNGKRHVAPVHLISKLNPIELIDL